MKKERGNNVLELEDLLFFQFMTEREKEDTKQAQGQDQEEDKREMREQ